MITHTTHMRIDEAVTVAAIVTIDFGGQAFCHRVRFRVDRSHYRSSNQKVVTILPFFLSFLFGWSPIYGLYLEGAIVES